MLKNKGGRMLSFFGKQKVKDTLVTRMNAHALADEIIKGQYWENGKGCFVGCAIHGATHARFETELGLPEWLARLADTLFEGLPNREAKQFAVDLPQAIPVGVELTPVKWRFCAILLQENIERVLTLTISAALKEQVVSAIRQVLGVHEQALKDGKWDQSAAGSAESAAWAAWSAAESAAESAAWSAARSVESAAWSVARSAAWSVARSVESAAGSAAGSAAFTRYAEELLRLLREAK